MEKKGKVKVKYRCCGILMMSALYMLAVKVSLYLVAVSYV